MKVVWMHKARFAFIKTAKYVRDNFGEKTARDLYDAVNACNAYLAANPYIGKIEPLLDNRAITYRCLIVKRLNKIIYRIDNNNVTVIDFWNLRQSPKNLQQRVK